MRVLKGDNYLSSTDATVKSGETDATVKSGEISQHVRHVPHNTDLRSNAIFASTEQQHILKFCCSIKDCISLEGLTSLRCKQLATIVHLVLNNHTHSFESMHVVVQIVAESFV